MIYFKPFKSNFQNKLDIFNEVINLSINYLTIFFTDYYDDVDKRSIIGYCMIA
jgi:hypothetical protein